MNIASARFSRLTVASCSFLYPGAIRQIMTCSSSQIKRGSATGLVHNWRSVSKPFATTSVRRVSYFPLSSNQHDTLPSTSNGSPHSETRKRTKRKFDYLFPPTPPSHIPVLISPRTGRVYDVPQNLEQLASIALTMVSEIDGNVKPEDRWGEESDNFISHITMNARRPTPYTGRSVDVTTGSRSTADSFRRAYYILNSTLRKNNLFAMVKAQSRHEKKGYKRRRLASQTHRRKFAQMVRQKVALVEKIRKRGG